jgi:hypothetical protein
MAISNLEKAGRIYRYQKSDRQALDYIDAELSEAANNLRIAACQLENLLANTRSDVGPALARIDMPAILRNLAARNVLLQKLAAEDRVLRKLRKNQ